MSGRERLAFRTQIVGGISHRSEGRITKRRLPEGEGAYDVPGLEGALVKFRPGRDKWSIQV